LTISLAAILEEARKRGAKNEKWLAVIYCSEALLKPGSNAVFVATQDSGDLVNRIVAVDLNPAVIGRPPHRRNSLAQVDDSDKRWGLWKPVLELRCALAAASVVIVSASVIERPILGQLVDGTVCVGVKIGRLEGLDVG